MKLQEQLFPSLALCRQDKAFCYSIQKMATELADGCGGLPVLMTMPTDRGSSNRPFCNWRLLLNG